MNEKLRLKIIALAIVALAFLGYAYWQAKDLLQGPQIHITAPENGALISSTTKIIIKGYAENTVELILNGNTVFIDESGRFEEPMLLSKGYNLITLSAKDRFGKSVEETIELVHER